MKIVMAGEGAIARKHLAGLARIDGIEVVSLAGGIAADTEALATELDIGHWSLDLAECLAQPGVDAAILATPTQLHAAQAIQVLEAGKHVLVEIPMADNLADSERLVDVAARLGTDGDGVSHPPLQPSHQWVHNKIVAGRAHAPTSGRRDLLLSAGEQERPWPASDVDRSLLWHHACHTVDLFQYQTGEVAHGCLRACKGRSIPDSGSPWTCRWR